MSAVELFHLVDGPAEGPVDGGRPPLLLGNSLCTTLAMWESSLPGLTAAGRVIRFDLRGHGRSPAPPGPYTLAELGGDVLALLDRLGIERVDYAGVSIGGMVGMWLAASAPERVRRLVVVCSSAKLDSGAFRARAQAVLAAGSTAPVVDAVLARWFTPGFAAAHAPVLAELREMFVATPAGGYAGCCEALASMDLRPELPRIGAPTLVIGGAQDEALPPAAHSEPIARAIPGARYELVSPAAHIAPIERAAEVTGLILGHLGVVPAGISDAARRLQGMRIRRAVLGDAHVDRAVATTTAFTEGFQDFITRVAWGDIWAREGLDRRTRSAITLATLTALGREGELELHVRAAIRNGLTVSEIGEVLLHTAVYAGVPAANAALALARRVLSEDGLI